MGGFIVCLNGRFFYRFFAGKIRVDKGISQGFFADSYVVKQSSCYGKIQESFIIFRVGSWKLTANAYTVRIYEHKAVK